MAVVNVRIQPLPDSFPKDRCLVTQAVHPQHGTLLPFMGQTTPTPPALQVVGAAAGMTLACGHKLLVLNRAAEMSDQ